MLKKIIYFIIILTSFTVNAEAGTVGLWLFDELGGNTAYDSSGNANDGIIYGASRIADTPFSYAGNFAMSFDGLSDYIDCGALLNPGFGAFTVEAWIKTDQVGSWTGIVEKYSNGLLIHGGRAGGQLWDGSSNPWLIGSTTVNDGYWHHIAFQRNIIDDMLYIYVDGVLDNAGVVDTAGSIQNAFILAIGNDSAGSYYFDGLIDEVRISDTALSAEEMGYYRSFGSPVNPVPEPSSLLLLGIGIFGAALAKRRQRPER